MIFLMIINMILHLDDNILMWIELLPSLSMILLFLFCFRGVMPVSEMSEMSAMCMMYSCML